MKRTLPALVDPRHRNPVHGMAKPALFNEIKAYFNPWNGRKQAGSVGMPYRSEQEGKNPFFA